MCGYAVPIIMSKFNRKRGSIRTILPENKKYVQKDKFSPWRMKIFELIDFLQTNTNSGLTTQNVSKRRKKYGLNILYPEFKRTFYSSFIDHLKSVISVLLALSAFIFFVFNKNAEYLISAGIITLSIIIDCVCEHIASKKFEKVRKHSSLKAVVKRNDRVYVTDSRYLVPGDLVYLQQGSIVPADIRLYDSNGLVVLETPLTGNETEIKKYAKDIPDDNSSDSIYINMAYAGSIVTEGNAWGIVCFTANKTKFQALAGNKFDNVPSLFKYVYSVSTMLSILSSFLGALILIFGIFFSSSLTSIYMLSLAVSACSFADTVVSLSALSFAKGIDELNNDGAILKNLNSVENLALTDSLLIKQNTVFPILKTEVDSFYVGLDKTVDSYEELDLIKYFLVCSDVKKTFSKSTKKNSEFEGKQSAVALAMYAEEKGFSPDSLSNEFLITETNKNEADEWFCALAFEKNQKYLFIKGTPAEILPLCKYHNTLHGIKQLTQNDINNYHSFSSVLTNDAGYILAIAKCETGIDKISDYQNDRILTLCGFVKFTTYFGIDFFKEVSECKSAGIDVCIFSSDTYMRAYNLSKNSGIFSQNEQVITAEEMNYISPKEFSETYSKYKLFMDFSPSLFNSIVKLRKKKKSTVAISAESTSDLVVMKNADVSFVIEGESSETIKQSSDVILQKGGFDKINKVLATSKKIYRRIHSLSEYAVYNYFSLILIYIIGTIFGLKFKTTDFLILSTVVSGAIGFFICTTPMSDSSKYLFPKRERKVAHPAYFYRSYVLAIQCSLSCVITSKFASSTKENTVMMLTFVFFSLLASLTILNKESPFHKSFIGANKNIIFTGILMLLFFIVITRIPYLVKILSYKGFAITDIVLPAILSISFFVIDSTILYKNKSRTK